MQYCTVPDRPKMSGSLHNCHPARRVRDANLLVVRRYCIIHETAVILRDESVGITTEICTLNDIPTSNVPHLDTFPFTHLPILCPAACIWIYLRIPACARTTITRRRRFRLTSSALSVVPHLPYKCSPGGLGDSTGS